MLLLEGQQSFLQTAYFPPWKIRFYLVSNVYYCCLHRERFGMEMGKLETQHFAAHPENRVPAVRQLLPALPYTHHAKAWLFHHHSCSQRCPSHRHWFHCINLVLQSADDKSLYGEMETTEIRENAGISSTNFGSFTKGGL